MLGTFAQQHECIFVGVFSTSKGLTLELQNN